MTTGEDTHGCDYITSPFLLPQLCNSTFVFRGKARSLLIGSFHPEDVTDLPGASTYAWKLIQSRAKLACMIEVRA